MKVVEGDNKIRLITSDCTTQVCLKNVLTSGLVLGCFPLGNLRNEDPSHLQFKISSGKSVYSALMALAFLLFAIFAFVKSFSEGVFLHQLISPLFYFHVFFTTVIFWRMAQRWPKFVLKWTRFETHLSRRYKNSINVYKRVNLAALIFLMVALIEHSLSVVNAALSTSCDNSETGWQHYYFKQFHFVFRYFPYNAIFGFCLIILNWTAAAIWSYGDTFLILISIIVTSRFNQITRRIQRYSQELSIPLLSSEISTGVTKVFHVTCPKTDYKFWREIREDYDKMNQMIRSLNDLLNNLVLLSYTCNLTFILVQLFNSLKKLESAIEGVYFFYSFGYVIVRIVTVSIFGASINEESQASLPYLNSIPTEIYNEEIQRLITQIHVDSSALTGHNFFRITKGLVLSVAAAIITYELVLIQFNQATVSKYTQDTGANATSTICY